MDTQRVLVIEDDPDIVELLQYNLQREGFEVCVAQTGEEGKAQAIECQPSLILLDLMLPRTSGLDVCRELRAREDTKRTPLIMVTAKGEETDVVLGLELGADDYVTKPFSVKELIARIHSVLRRTEVRPPEASSRIERDALVIDNDRHEVLLNGQQVDLTLAEFRLLRALAGSPGRVFTREQLIGQITAGGYVIAERNVDVHVAAIRRKMKEISELIVTVRGIGYKFKD